MEWSEETKKHFQEHLKWPMTGQQIIEACNSMEDVPEDERKMIEDMVDADKTYNSLDELMEDLKPAEPDEDEEEM